MAHFNVCFAHVRAFKRAKLIRNDDLKYFYDTLTHENRVRFSYKLLPLFFMLHHKSCAPTNKWSAALYNFMIIFFLGSFEASDCVS